LSAMMGLRRWSISFSNSFDMIGSNEICRYDYTSLSLSPGFMITLAVFHVFGIEFTRMQALINIVNLTKAFPLKCRCFENKILKYHNTQQHANSQGYINILMDRMINMLYKFG
jgi:hypothetical protein